MSDARNKNDGPKRRKRCRLFLLHLLHIEPEDAFAIVCIGIICWIEVYLFLTGVL